MSTFHSPASALGHAARPLGLDQTPSDELILTSPDAEQFLSVSQRLSTPSLGAGQVSSPARPPLEQAAAHASGPQADAPMPSTGHSPDLSYGEISQHTTPSFDDDFLNDALGLMPHLDDLGLSPSALAPDAPATTVSVADGEPYPIDVWSTAASYPISPVHTSTPSPFTRSEGHDPTWQRSGSPTTLLGPMPATGPQPAESVSGQSSRPTPDLSNGSRHASTETLGLARSPVFRIETCGWQDSIPPRDGSSELSPTHLSPPVDPVAFFDDAPELEPSRAEDGSWIPSAVTGQAGVDPTQRELMKDVQVPTLRKQQENRQIEEKNADVALWLAGASPGGRRRARTTGEVGGPPLDPLRLDIRGRAFEPSGLPGSGAPVDVENGHEVGEGNDDEMDDTDTITGELPDANPPASPRARQAGDKTPVAFDPAAPGPKPDPPRFFPAYPWADPLLPSGEATDAPQVPQSSNAAMMMFLQRADSLETASRAATWGTRRMSDTDVERFFRQPTMFKRLSVGKDKDKAKAKAKEERRGLFELTRLLSRKSSHNLKRKNSDKTVPDPANSPTEKDRNERLPSVILTRSASTSSKLPRSLMASTGATVAVVAHQLAALGGSSAVGATATAAPSSPWAQAKSVIKRTRSKSDLHRRPELKETHSSSLSTLMARYGGPPVAKLASSPKEPEIRKPPSSTAVVEDEEDENDDDDAVEGEGVEMDLHVRSDPVTPTLEGFRHHAKQLNPGMEAFLVERVSQEQVRRHVKLVEAGNKHRHAVLNGKCSSGSFCFDLGGQAEILPPKASNRESKPLTAGFEVTTTTGLGPGEHGDQYGDAAVASTQIQQGIPPLPVKRLPARFECPLCFKVREFQKPSDWTKHVQEDLQPFTCTFADCAEPKSFKRKADWVRHENELHRKLEWWDCSLPDCPHVCYRKDNFVQHLVREHKMPEPKVKATKTVPKGTPPGNARGPNGPLVLPEEGRSGQAESSQEEIDRVWALVKECRRDTLRLPREEPCKFCGNIYGSWQKLTSHLSKHMMQISLPILGLVEQQQQRDAYGAHFAPARPRVSAPPPPRGSSLASGLGLKMEQGFAGTSGMVPQATVNGYGGLQLDYQSGGALYQPPAVTPSALPLYGVQGAGHSIAPSFSSHMAGYAGPTGNSTYSELAYLSSDTIRPHTIDSGSVGSLGMTNAIPQAPLSSYQGASGQPTAHPAHPRSHVQHYPPHFGLQRTANAAAPSPDPDLHIPVSTGDQYAGSASGTYSQLNGVAFGGQSYVTQPKNFPYQRS